MPGPVPGGLSLFCNFHDTVLTVLCQAKPGRSFTSICTKNQPCSSKASTRRTEAQAEKLSAATSLAAVTGYSASCLPAAQEQRHGAQLLAGGHRRRDALRQGRAAPPAARRIPLGWPARCRGPCRSVRHALLGAAGHRAACRARRRAARRSGSGSWQSRSPAGSGRRQSGPCCWATPRITATSPSPSRSGAGRDAHPRPAGGAGLQAGDALVAACSSLLVLTSWVSPPRSVSDQMVQ